jgi:uncharacterized membrane protein YozB (DUF420 family)
VWPLILLSILLLVVFAIFRLIDIFGTVPPLGTFEARYLDHPVTSVIHMLTGIIFIVLAPIQFLKKFRARNLNVHRWLGRVLIPFALVAGFYGMAASIILPGFGGIASETATWVFGPIFLFSLLRAYWCVRNKFIAQHREWMIRAFAIALAVGTQRLFLLVFMSFDGYDFEELFGPGLWFGFSANLLIAEIWINVSRSKGSVDS